MDRFIYSFTCHRRLARRLRAGRAGIGECPASADLEGRSRIRLSPQSLAARLDLNHLVEKVNRNEYKEFF